MRRLSALMLALALSLGPAAGQHEVSVPTPEAGAADFDTSYRPSPSLSARLQREFLTRIRWSAGAELRDGLVEAFAEKPPVEIWQELVKGDGLTTNNVVDALIAYWVLNWVTANGAYSARIDNAPIRRQLQQAMEGDQNFRTLNDQQRQIMAENHILDFLLEHAALNEAVARKDVPALSRLAAAAVMRFRQNMGVDLLAVEPGPEGFMPKQR